MNFINLWGMATVKQGLSEENPVVVAYVFILQAELQDLFVMEKTCTVLVAKV